MHFPRLTHSFTQRMQKCKDVIAKKAQYKTITLSISLKLRRFHQDEGGKGKDLVKRYPQYSKSCIYKHILKGIDDDTGVKRKCNPGRQKLLRSAQNSASKENKVNQKMLARTWPMCTRCCKDIVDLVCMRKLCPASEILVKTL